MNETLLSRRAALSLGVAAGAAPVLFGSGLLSALLHGTPAQAEAAAASGTAVYARPFGSGEILTILDGPFALEQSMIVNLPKPALEAALEAAYLPKDAPLHMPVTVHLIRLADRTLLVDSGAGGSFGPKLGRLVPALAAAGVDPGSITDIFVTHMHPDHIGGLLGESGATFPAAQLHMPEIDIAFWADEAQGDAAPEPMKPFFQLARSVHQTYGARVTPYSGEVDLKGGLRAMPLPGHTLGHTGLHLSDGDDQMMILGDAVVVAAYQFSHPEAGIAFDFDPGQAAATRKALLAQVAADRILVAATHLPFPGFGHVEQKGDVFAWVPEEWKLG